MNRYKGYYSLLQFCPKPERLEYVNVGVLLSIPEKKIFSVKFAEQPRRVEKLFGQQNKQHYQVLKEAFEERLRCEFSSGFESESLNLFGSKRANELRMTKLLPLPVSDIEESLDKLFTDLVGEEPIHYRSPMVKTKLKKIFVEAGVLPLLDNPSPVVMPEYDIEVSVPYGYQNGSYNLIDPVRLDHESKNEALKEAGQRAIEGELLAKHFAGKPNRKRLIVVGDFDGQPDNFFSAVQGVMAERSVPLYRLDDLQALVQDIKTHSVLHGRTQ